MKTFFHFLLGQYQVPQSSWPRLIDVAPPLVRRSRSGLVLWLVLGTTSPAGAESPLPQPVPLNLAEPALPAPPVVSRSLVTFAPAHAEMTYLVRIQSSDGVVTQCYTPCTLALPSGPARVSVLAPKSFTRDIELTGRPTLVKVSHRSPWRYGVGGLLLGISLAEFIYGAVLFPWNGGGSTTNASVAAAAWAFGAIELTTASTLLGLGGKNSLQVVDDPTLLKAERSGGSRPSLRLAGLGGFAAPAAGGVQARFQF